MEHEEPIRKKFMTLKFPPALRKDRKEILDPTDWAASMDKIEPHI
jgi:hypothetical protein